MSDLEMLKLIQHIRTYSRPPYKENDKEYKRYPWCKFGCLGYYGGWKWYYTKDIYMKVTEDDIRMALAELKE